jgi:hypothetical protein
MLVAVTLLAALALAPGCHHHLPPIRFAPRGTDGDQLRNSYALSDAERNSLSPDVLRQLDQAQVDQIYQRLSPGPIPDGAFAGDLFFPRGVNRRVRIRDVAPSLPAKLSALAAMPFEDLGRLLWKGKVFFKSDGILRNRIDDLLLLKPLIPDSSSIPKATFDGQTTWLLFPAQVSCGTSMLEPSRHAIVIDYSKGPQIQGYREIPDGLAGPTALDIRDEIRVVKPGLYLGRAYFRGRFGLNFTLVKPVGSPGVPTEVQDDCGQMRLP